MPETALKTVHSQILDKATPLDIPLRIGVKTNKPTDKQINALLDDVLHSRKYSFAATAANLSATHPTPTDQMFREFLSPPAPGCPQATCRSRDCAAQSSGRASQDAFRSVRCPRSQTICGICLTITCTTPASKLDPNALKSAIEKNRTSTLRLSMAPATIEPSEGNKIKLKLPNIEPTVKTKSLPILTEILRRQFKMLLQAQSIRSLACL